MLASLNAEGKIPVLKERLKISVRDGARTLLQHFKMEGRTPSGPGALLTSKLASTLSTVPHDTIVNSHKSSAEGGPQGTK